MRRVILLSVILSLATGLCFADRYDDTLRFYLGKSDLVVTGKFTKVSNGEMSPVGVLNDLWEFSVAEVLKGEESLKGKTISVFISQFGLDKKDKNPLLKEDSECILFLKDEEPWSNPRWHSADFWFAIHYPSPQMVKTLKRLVKEPSPNLSAEEDLVKQCKALLLEFQTRFDNTARKAGMKDLLKWYHSRLDTLMEQHDATVLTGTILELCRTYEPLSDPVSQTLEKETKSHGKRGEDDGE